MSDELAGVVVINFGRWPDPVSPRRLSTDRTEPSGSVISVAGHEAGNDAFSALRYCGKCQLHSLRFLWAGDSISRIMTLGVVVGWGWEVVAGGGRLFNSLDTSNLFDTVFLAFWIGG